tara:strand:- start:698 stop:886 length:189 start_codon:yes stop_codon:yes gene_type:complete
MSGKLTVKKKLLNLSYKKYVMSSKFFGNSKVKGPINNKNKKKIKIGGSMKSTTAVRKTGRGN